MIPQYRQTQGQGKRRLLTPDEVLRLPNQELLVVIRGHNLLKLEKVDYTELPLSKEIVRSSVLEYRPERLPNAPQAQAPFSREAKSPQEKPQRKPRLYGVSKPPDGF